MNKILRKLRSKAGESMILAMVFMLFCVFIGGSVLASATANAYRVEHLSDQQDYLSQRSAAKLISDELEGSSNKKLRLTVADVDLLARKVVVGNGGVISYTGETHTERTVTFKAPSGLVMTPFQRLVFETTVAKYLEENNLAPSQMPATGKTTVVVELEGFQYRKIKSDGSTEVVNITSVNDFWLKDNDAQKLKTSGQLELTGTMNLGITHIPTDFESCGGERLYDFAVSFGDYSQMTLALSASKGEKHPVELTRITPYSNGSTVNWTEAEVTTYTRQPVISWDYPLIEKGGV